MSDVTREQVIDYLSNMPVIELSSLIHELEGKWGVSAQPMQLEAPVPLPGVPPTTPEEKTEFDVVVTNVPADKKIAAIKIVRDASGLGLKEAKEMVDNVASKPAVVKQGISKADAEELVKKLKDVGCSVQLQ
jgi:large subunit ribosomal protein L7/L12